MRSAPNGDRSSTRRDSGSTGAYTRAGQTRPAAGERPQISKSQAAEASNRHLFSPGAAPTGTERPPQAGIRQPRTVPSFLRPRTGPRYPPRSSARPKRLHAVRAAIGCPAEVSVRTLNFSLGRGERVGPLGLHQSGLEEFGLVDGEVGDEPAVACELREHLENLLVGAGGVADAEQRAPDRRRRARPDDSLRKHERGLTPDESRTTRTTPPWQRPLTDRQRLSQTLEDAVCARFAREAGRERALNACLVVTSSLKGGTWWRWLLPTPNVFALMVATRPRRSTQSEGSRCRHVVQPCSCLSRSCLLCWCCR